MSGIIASKSIKNSSSIPVSHTNNHTQFNHSGKLAGNLTGNVTSTSNTTSKLTRTNPGALTTIRSKDLSVASTITLLQFVVFIIIKTKINTGFIKSILRIQSNIPGLSPFQIIFFSLYLATILGGLAYENLSGLTISRMFRRFGLMAIVQLPLLFVLSMRNNLCGLFGKGYESVNFLHRWVGRSLVLCALGHGIMILKLQVAPISVVLSRPVFLNGSISLAILLVISISSLSPIRKRIYQVFKFIHVLGFPLLLFALWKHTPTTHSYVYVSLGCVILDRLLRLIHTRWRTAHFTSLPGSVTMIEVTGTGTGWKAGQHVYLRVYSPKYILEQHPFTIANAPASYSPYGSNNTLILVTKAHGDYTRKLHDIGLTKAALEPEWTASYESSMYSGSQEMEKKGGEAYDFADEDSQLLVSVEGPYGTMSLDMRSNETAVLIATGIGITFCMSLLEEIVGSRLRGVGTTRNIIIVWSLKDIDMVEAFLNPIQETLRVARALELRVCLRLHVTSSMGTFTPEPIPELYLIHSRPDMEELFQDAITSTIADVESRGVSIGDGIGVAVCSGVNSLIENVQNSIVKIGLDEIKKVGGIELHLERFGNG
ncbi:ferric reductase like transmembrane component-domain-containing protein [Melampsora americana]|nr:ferric reductase like transmembrane component-domain-containing protein [Melampsora americana]